MTTPAIPLCESCARLGPCGNTGMGTCCEAFPAGIPDAIYVDGGDHRQPVDGDGGVTFLLSAEAGAGARLAAYEASLT